MASDPNDTMDKNKVLNTLWGPSLSGQGDPWNQEVSKIWDGDVRPTWDRGGGGGTGNSYGGANTWGVNRNSGLFPGSSGESVNYGQPNPWAVHNEYDPFGKNWSGGGGVVGSGSGGGGVVGNGASVVSGGVGVVGGLIGGNDVAGGNNKDELKKSYSMAELKDEVSNKEAHKSSSTGSFVDERSQPDGAEMLQHSKDEMIAKMVNSHDGWGKKPIRQDTPWDHPLENLSLDPNIIIPQGTAIEPPRADGVWKPPTFDIPSWPVQADDNTDPLEQLYRQQQLQQQQQQQPPWQQGWTNDSVFEKALVDPNAAAAAHYWNENKPQQQQQAPQGMPQKPLSIGTWGEVPNTQTEFGVWNQPPLQQSQSQMTQALQYLMENGVKREDAINILLSNDKAMEMMGGGRMGEGRGRMLRGKSLVETPFSAFQPPAPQQLQQQPTPQQLLKAGLTGLFNQPPMHRRSTSNNFGGGNKNQQGMLQTFLQLQSLLQPMLLERSQLQQNKMMSMAQKKNRIDVLNADIVRIKACIDQLSTDHMVSSSNDERSLLQALGSMRLEQEMPQDTWNAPFKHYPPPPPPGLLTKPPPNHFNRSTSWSLGEKKNEVPHMSSSNNTPARASNWLMIKDTANIEGAVLYNVCRQNGTLLQLLSNHVTGHSIACYREDATVVQSRLMQGRGLACDPLTNQDILRLLDASNGGAAWVAVTAPPSPPHNNPGNNLE